MTEDTNKMVINAEVKESEIKPEDENVETIIQENKKKLYFGILIGGAIFIILLIIVLILILLPVTPNPTPPEADENPYKIKYMDFVNNITITAVLVNTRSRSPEKLDRGGYGFENTSDNYEPLYLNATFIFMDDHTIQLKIIDPNHTRTDPKLYYHNEMDDAWINTFQHFTYIELGFQFEDNPFGFTLYGYNNTQRTNPIFSTKNRKLAYYDKYIEFEAAVQTPRIYGMLDHGGSFGLKPGLNYSLWNTNAHPLINASAPRHSSHPFFINQLKNDQFIGVFMHNLNAMQFQIQSHLSNTSVFWRMTGGIIDLWIFYASDANWILRKYHSLIGYSYPIPLWAMGFHHHNNSNMKTQDLLDTVNAYEASDMPVDSIATGVNLSSNGRIFSVSDTFKDIGNFVNMLHDKRKPYNMHFIATIIPAIIRDMSYNYTNFLVGNKSGVLYCDQDKGLLVGTSDYGESYLPDFFNPVFNNTWHDGLTDLFSIVNFDGLFFLDNEPGLYSPSNSTSDKPYCKQYSSLPFQPVTFGYNSIPINSRYQIPGIPLDLSSDFNFHNQYCLAMLDTSYRWTEKNIVQPFLISSSTTPGAGHVGTHTTGENPASFELMKESILSMLNFNLFGIPHIGTNIGGYRGTLSDELYIRWYQLGAFYPLARIYMESDDGGSNTRGPLGRGHDNTETILEIMRFRYSFIRFYFTKMVESYLWGGAVVHPLFFDFPADDETFRDEITDSTFMIGNAIYVAPVLTSQATTLDVYFPNARWYELDSFTLVKDYDPAKNNTGEFEEFQVNIKTVKAFIRGGSIVPFQHIYQYQIHNTYDLENSPLTIIVAPDHTGRAMGSMLFTIPDVWMRPQPDSNTYKHFSLTYFDKRFRFNQIAGFDLLDYSFTEDFDVLMLLDELDFTDIQFACVMDRDLNVYELGFTTLDVTKTIVIFKNPGDFTPMNFARLESIVFGGKNDHNFCSPALKVTKTDYFNNDREMTARLETYNPNELELHYTVIGKLLNNKLMSFQVAMIEENDPWIVPDAIEEYTRNTINSSITLGQFGFKMADDNKDFFFEIVNPDERNDFIFTTRNLRFSYQDNFIHMKALIKSKHVFGFGERILKFDIPDGRYTMFTRDETSPFETGRIPGNNIYGQHPFYMFQLMNPHEFAAVLILTSNPMDVRIRHLGIVTEIDHVITGGVLDMFIISKGSMMEVLRNYHLLIGSPYLLPYWAFGYHQCRWGYDTLSKMDNVVNSFTKNNLPFDVLWNDIDYMWKYEDFVVDFHRYYGLKDWVQNTLISNGRHYVPIIDGGLAIKFDYDIYKKAVNLGVLLKSARTKEPLVGIVWPGYAVYPDFMNPLTQKFWEDSLTYFTSQVYFSGIWLDMNEVSNFCDGECPTHDRYIMHFFPPNTYDDLYYIPGHRMLEKKTASMSAQHYPDALGNPQIEFNLHSMFGFYQARATNRYFLNVRRERPFILSRSTFIGSGRYTSHWLGDNSATWDYLRMSIPGIFNSNLFGIPHSGADVCGFLLDYNYELCARWYQLGGFYPFFRNHNFINSTSKEPFVEPNLMTVFRNTMMIRYGLLRYIYSHYFNLIIYGGMLFKPFLYYYPMDPQAYTYMDTSLMLGPSVYVFPVLTPGVSSMSIYLPNDDWFDIQGRKVFSFNSSNIEGGNITVSASLPNDPIPWFIRGGHILTWQDANNANTTLDMKKREVSLMVARHSVNHTAFGIVYYDHDDYSSLFTRQFHYIEINYTKNDAIYFETVLNQQFNYDLNKYYQDEGILKINIFDSEDLNVYNCIRAFDTRAQKFFELDHAYNPQTKMTTFQVKSGETDHDLSVRYTLNITMTKDKCPPSKTVHLINS